MHNQAGLFSAVNTAFILAMRPNPVDTTNALLAHQYHIDQFLFHPVINTLPIHRPVLFIQHMDTGACIYEPRTQSTRHLWYSHGQAVAGLLQNKPL